MIATGQKTKDPICGMDVDEKSAAGTIQHLGQSYSFCSQRCLEKFRADPSALCSPTPRLRLPLGRNRSPTRRQS